MKLSGTEVLSEHTTKASRYLLVVASTVLFLLWFKLPIEDLKFFGVSGPPEFFGVVAFFLLIYGIYNLLIQWVADIAAFRLWYREQGVITIVEMPSHIFSLLNAISSK